jgi:hypothetical protein
VSQGAPGRRFPRDDGGGVLAAPGIRLLEKEARHDRADHPVASPAAARDDRNLRLAWATLALLPVALIVPMFLALALGVEDQTRAPFGVFVIVVLVLAALLAVPVLLAWRFANRARSHGDDRARVPAVIASVAAVAFLAMNVVSWVLWLIQDTV